MSDHIALATIKSAQLEELTTKINFTEDPTDLLKRKTYQPAYVPLARDPYRSGPSR